MRTIERMSFINDPITQNSDFVKNSVQVSKVYFYYTLIRHIVWLMSVKMFSIVQNCTVLFIYLNWVSYVT